jgi:hypothetical protein
MACSGTALFYFYYTVAHGTKNYAPVCDVIRQIKSRKMRRVGHVTLTGEKWKVYRVLVGKPEGKRPLGKPRLRGEDGIRMDLREIGWGNVEWIQLVQAPRS